MSVVSKRPKPLSTGDSSFWLSVAGVETDFSLITDPQNVVNNFQVERGRLVSVFVLSIGDGQSLPVVSFAPATDYNFQMADDRPTYEKTFIWNRFCAIVLDVGFVYASSYWSK